LHDSLVQRFQFQNGIQRQILALLLFHFVRAGEEIRQIVGEFERFRAADGRAVAVVEPVSGNGQDKRRQFRGFAQWPWPQCADCFDHHILHKIGRRVSITCFQ